MCKCFEGWGGKQKREFPCGGCSARDGRAAFSATRQPQPHRQEPAASMCREGALSDLNLILYVTSVEWNLHSKGKQHHNPISLVLFYCLSRRSHINPQRRHSQGLSSARKSFFAHSQGFISLVSGEQWNTHISGGDGLFCLQPPSPHGSLGDGWSTFPLCTVLPAHLVLSKDAHCCGEDGGSASLLHSDVFH